MDFRVEISADAEHDFGIIFEFLTESYLRLGENADGAIVRAEARLREIRQAADSLAAAPHRGTLHDDLLPGLRHVTIGRAVFWFDVDDSARAVRILAVFFGGQDHHRHMLVRLLGLPR